MAYVGLFTGLASLMFGLLGEPGSTASYLSVFLLPFSIVSAIIAALGG